MRSSDVEYAMARCRPRLRQPAPGEPNDEFIAWCRRKRVGWLRYVRRYVRIYRDRRQPGMGQVPR